MKFVQKYDYRPITRVTKATGGRHYVCPDTGAKMASVTTILSATSDKQWIEAWKKRVGEEQAEYLRKTGTNIGTIMHDRLERYMLGEELAQQTFGIHKLAADMANQIIKHGLKDVDEVWGIEAPLWMSPLFSGTTDIVGVYKGKEAIMDFKSAKVMRFRSDIEDYLHQLCAYRLCHNETYGTNIETGVIFMVDRNLAYQTFVFEKEEMILGSEAFLDRVEKFYALSAG